jgi:hypothetical protein
VGLANRFADVFRKKASSPRDDAYKRTRRASVSLNERCIEVTSMAHHRAAIRDPNAQEQLLAPDVDDEVLGAAVLRALQESRFVRAGQMDDLRRAAELDAARWLTAQMAQFGYKNKSAIFRHMKHLSVDALDDSISIQPSNHTKLEYWTFADMDCLTIPVNSTPQEVGAAVRLGFDRCIDSLRK